jgi:uncharacterized protein (TIGR03000 family)
MLRTALSWAALPAVVGAAVLLCTAPGQSAPPPGAGHTPSFHAPPASSFRVPPAFVVPAPQTHYYPPPSYRPSYEPPLQSYYRSHYYSGAFPNANYYSYYDNPSPYNFRRIPTSGTLFDLGGGTSSLGPFYPDEYPYPGMGTPETGAGRSREDAIARLTVKVPADAEVKFDGYKTTSTGPVRRFETPLLARGKPYTYEVQARWQENGRDVTQKKEVSVSAGGDIQIDFPLPSGGAPAK